MAAVHLKKNDIAGGLINIKYKYNPLEEKLGGLWSKDTTIPHWGTRAVQHSIVILFSYPPAIISTISSTIAGDVNDNITIVQHKCQVQLNNKWRGPDWPLQIERRIRWRIGHVYRTRNVPFACFLCLFVALIPFIALPAVKLFALAAWLVLV